MLGFLSGSAAAGAAVYYYILSEYRTANEMLSEDIYVCLLPPCVFWAVKTQKANRGGFNFYRLFN